jgi:uncharacterized membrane protein YphA (DoxX/SURF4 family)
LVLTLRFAVAIVLGVAALAKARSFDGFRRTVDVVVPWRRGVSATGVAVIVSEAALAVLLAAGVWASVVAAATLIMFVGFAGISLWAERRGLHVSCNCFGQSDRQLGKDSAVMSLLLAAATLVYLVLLQATEPSLSAGELPLAVTLGMAAVMGGRWLLAAGNLASIVRQRRVLERELAEPARRAAR